MAETQSLTELTIAEARAGLDRGDFTAEALTQAHLAAMDRAAGLNAYITTTPERALAMARESDRRVAAGQARSLEGIPIAVKDLFCTEGVATTAGSHILSNFVPPYESTVTANLWAAGAVMLGKANLDEFAMGSANTNSYFGPALNPWTADGDDRPRVPGGSSGGSAAAVAARIAMGATGTDTGGSIRQPAAFCGLPGMKPTYGRCSRWGIVAFASSLDQAGPMARTVGDNARLLGAMAGWDKQDSTSVDRPVPDYTASLERGVGGLTIGLPREFVQDDTPAAVRAAWEQAADRLRHAGATIVEATIPTAPYALPAYYILAPAEASSNLARYDGARYGVRVEEPGDGLADMYKRSRAAGFGAEVRRRVLLGTYTLSAGYYDAYYKKAQKVRARVLQDFETAFDRVDALLAPTAPGTAFVRGDKEDDPVSMYLNDVFTIPASLAGLPGMNVPAGRDGAGLPLGVQVMGRPFDEPTVFQVAAELERGFGPAPSPYGGG